MTTLEIVLASLLYVIVVLVLLWTLSLSGSFGRAFGCGDAGGLEFALAVVWPLWLALALAYGAAWWTAWVLTRRGPLHGLHHLWFPYSCMGEPVHRDTRLGRLPINVTFWPCTVCSAALRPSVHEDYRHRFETRDEEAGETFTAPSGSGGTVASRASWARP